MAETIRRIALSQVEGLQVGHAGDERSYTGVSVLYFPGTAHCGSYISGGGPASRETPLGDPLTADHAVHAIVLSGGSAFGLAAADGVMRALEERGIGFPVGDQAVVPLVCQSCIFDLGFGDGKVRPDAEMGYAAAQAALAGTSDAHGLVGGGLGATTGKLLGMGRASKSGLGWCALQLGPLQVAAIVVVNAAGDIYRWQDHEQIGGLRAEDRKGFVSSLEVMAQLALSDSPLKIMQMQGQNTTIGAVITNAHVEKPQTNRIARIAGGAYARCINPVGTQMDGDSIYCASVGTVLADPDLVGTLAAEAMAGAIEDAALSSRMSDEDFLAAIPRS